jgi:hypothetical protein
MAGLVKFVCHKAQGTLRPVGVVGEEALAMVPDGGMVLVEMTKPRNPAHHAKFFALLNLIFKNQSHYRTQDEMLDAIKVYVGHCDFMYLRDGSTVARPKSISFAKMDQLAFNDFYARVVDVVCQYIIPNMDKEDLKRELEAFAA